MVDDTINEIRASQYLYVSGKRILLHKCQRLCTCEKNGIASKSVLASASLPSTLVLISLRKYYQLCHIKIVS
jgi:hypothetical protein